MLDHCHLGHLNFQHQQSLYRPKVTFDLDSSGNQGEHTQTSSLIPKTSALHSCTNPKSKAAFSLRLNVIQPPENIPRKHKN
jgi:hypothetical protein